MKNDTGSQLNVGPDVNGDYFSVDPGEEYELPEAPRGVADEAPAEEEAPATPSGDLGSKPDQSPAGKNPPAGETPPAADTTPPADVPPAGDQKGASA
jgi:hypothetical protein